MNYKRTDKIIDYINKQLIKLFAKLKAITSFDKLNILPNVNDVYRQADKLFHEMFVLLARKEYEAIAKEKLARIELYEEFIEELLEDYNEVTKYVFENELDRKRAKLFEALMASNTPAKEIDAALRAVSYMGKVMAVEVTDRAVLKAMKANGVKRIKWHSEHDNRVCRDCLDRDGKIYDIDKVPVKPHPNCRCWYEAV